MVIATIAGVVAALALGVWQLDRAGQKRALQRALDERGRMVPLGTAMLPAADQPPRPDLEHRRAELAGQWETAHTVYLDNRVMDGRTGFYVLTPLKLAGRHDAILVQRGWAPRNAAQREALPPVSTPTGDVRIAGRLAAAVSKAYALGRDAETGPIRQNVDLAAFQAETGLRLLPVVMLQTSPDRVAGAAAALPVEADAKADADADAGASADGLRRHWPPPSVDIHKHYGYAFQWFALAALILGLYVWFQVLAPYRAGRAARALDTDDVSRDA